MQVDGRIDILQDPGFKDPISEEDQKFFTDVYEDNIVIEFKT